MLDIKDLSVIFNQGTINEKVALDHINLHLDDGDFVTIIGSNGAGKSTLFQSIAGAVEVQSGDVILDGVNITHQKEYIRSRSIGRLFQDPLKGTAPSMTIEENLSLAFQRGKYFSLKPMRNKKHRKVFIDALKSLDLGLEERIHTKVGTLSGGQRQALTLMMATLVTPKLLLLDEHTAALDPATAQKVLTISNEIVEKNHITTMMITHNMEDAIKYGNRIIIMNKGKIIDDIKGEDKKKMTVDQLIDRFEEMGETDDRMMLKEK